MRIKRGSSCTSSVTSFAKTWPAAEPKTMPIAQLKKRSASRFVMTGDGRERDFSMSTIHANPGRFHYQAPRGGWGIFHPVGRLKRQGAHKNPPSWETDVVYAARLFVGFNVDEHPTYTLDDLVKLVKKVRDAQVGIPDASFIAQRGLYRHTSGRLKGVVVEEDGGQVIIINMASTPKRFAKEMMNLADIICATFKQESVILEIQKNGIMEKVYGMSATKAPPILKARTR